MQITKTHKIIISAVVVILLFGTYVVFDRKSRQKQNESITNDANQNVSTSTPSVDVKVVTEGPGYTIKQVPLSEGENIPKPTPDLSRVVIFSNTVNPETKIAIEAKIFELQSKLKEDITSVSAWLDLGIYQKMAGDFEGAVISWKYASRLMPESYVPLANLGDLYAYFLKDSGQAETYFKQAISKGPTQAYLYVKLAEIYRDVFKDMDKARDIVTQGLSKIPSDPNLLQLQSSL